MSHNHHSHISNHINRAFFIGIILNLAFVFIEFGAGLWLDSLALISDAGHNLSDVVSLVIAMFAFRLMRRKPTEKYTYGYKKGSVLASLLNACILLVAVGIILTEGIQKIHRPESIQGGMIAWVGGIGILINAFTAWLFLKDRKKDLNIKGAFLHMIADTLVSVGVVISGIIIHYTNWYILDPVISILIAIVILISTANLLKASLRLSLDGVPDSLSPSEIKNLILSEDSRIIDMHHIHIWAISTSENALTAHVVISSLDDMEELKHKIKYQLQHNGIAHTTLEFEKATADGTFHCCDENN